jgi:hypothetical protein
VFFSPVSGTLSGAGTSPGVWGLTFVASNADGDSSPETFTVGVYDVGGQTEYSKRVLINLKTLAVTCDDPAAVDSESALGAAAGQVRYGDEVVFQMVFTDGTIAAGTGASAIYSEISPNIRMARFSMKGNETEPTFFVTPPPAFKRSAEYEAGEYRTTYYVFAHIAGSALQSYLGDFENDAGTQANVICEFEIEFDRPAGASGPLITRVTTQPFLLRVSRDLIS